MRIALLMSRASSWARMIAHQLVRMGHLVHVIDFDTEIDNSSYFRRDDSTQQEAIRQLQAAVASIHLLPNRFSSLRYFFAAKELRKALEACQADYLLTLYGGGFATMAFLSGFRPYAVFAVGSDVLLIKGIGRLLSKISFRRARIVFANGNHLANVASKLNPSVIPLYHGIDLERFCPGTPSENPVKMICSRGFLPVYNNGYLIEGLARLPESLDYSLAFLAGGPEEAEVKQQVREILSVDLQTRISFRGGVSPDDLLKELQAAHIFISLSRSDGASTSLLEALACGLFPILSDIPANREWINPEVENGILVPLGQPDKLAAAIQKALSDDAMRQKASIYNRRLMLERANIKLNITRLSQILLSSLDPNSDNP